MIKILFDAVFYIILIMVYVTTNKLKKTLLKKVQFIFELFLVF